MDGKYYSNERSIQILISLLKQHGIKKCVLSPGATNITFVASLQQDSYFELYSSVDERSAAYIACGLAAESGEPVVLSCTGATASRNYLPGLTEAYYRKLPVLAVTSTQDITRIGHHIAQVVVADNCAEAANVIWGDYSNQSGFTLLLGGLFFTFQIYGDFSGYSDIAIGTARLFGINLMRNFNFPYFSRDIAEFWRRWHISLTTWFRDYIYIPLGGSRCVRWKVMRNTLIIFLVSGFWHGANWTFITWGAYHALLFFPLMLCGKNRKYTNSVAAGRFLPSVKEFGQMLFTFLLALIGWIIFRAENIGQAWDYLGRMCSSSLLDISIRWGKSALLYIVLLVIVEWFQRDKQHALQITGKGILLYTPVRWIIYFTIILFILLFAGGQTDFIYFQF